MSSTRIFYVAVHASAAIPAVKFRRILEQHGLLTYAAQGRASGPTYTPRQVLPRIAEALCDAGAIPFGEGGRSFFVTGLGEYWATAIRDLEQIGVRIYILPTLRAVEGLPDAVADAFDTYFQRRLEDLLNAANRGSDVSDLVEVLESQALAFEPEEIVLGDDHRDLIARIRARIAESHAAQVSTPTPAPSPALLPVSVPPVSVLDFDLADDL